MMNTTGVHRSNRNINKRSFEICNVRAYGRGMGSRLDAESASVLASEDRHFQVPVFVGELRV